MSEAFKSIEAAYAAGGLTRAIWKYLELFPDRPETAARAFCEKQGWA